MNKILITGGNGFAASYLKDLFSKDEVFLTDLKGEGIIPCDITNAKEVQKLIEKIKPDQIYHLAAIASPRIEHQDLVEKVNVGGTKNLLTAVRKSCPNAKILLVSSGYVYGDCKTPAKETDRINPLGAYAESKSKMEKLAQLEFADLDFYIARAFTHSGKGQSLGFFFPDVAKKISDAKATSNPVIEVFNPNTIRDFSHVKDIVRGYKAILEKGKVREAYNVCSGKAYKVMDIFEKMVKAAHLKDYQLKKIEHGIVLDLLGDDSKIKTLGYSPKYTVEDIIRDFSDS